MKTERIEMRVSKEFHNKVKKQVLKEERTVSDLIRQLLNEYLERKNGN